MVRLFMCFNVSFLRYFMLALLTRVEQLMLCSTVYFEGLSPVAFCRHSHYTDRKFHHAFFLDVVCDGLSELMYFPNGHISKKPRCGLSSHDP